MPLILIISSFAFLSEVYALKRWLIKLWWNAGALIIYSSISLTALRYAHAVLFTLALFQRILRLVVVIAASGLIAGLTFTVTSNLCIFVALIY